MKSSCAIRPEAFGWSTASPDWKFIRLDMKFIKHMKTMNVFSIKFSTKFPTKVTGALATVLVGAAFSGWAQSDRYLAALTKIASESATQVDTTIDGEETRQSTGSDAWLGIATSEASEALSSQLNLHTGVGLVVNFVATNSPAAKAGLRKNDVLVRFDDQELVHPAQLRKLVLMHKEGDEVKLGYYRGGKEHSVSVTLGKAEHRASWEDTQRAFEFKLNDFRNLFQENGAFTNHWNDAVNNFHRFLGNFKDDGELKESIRRGVDDARKVLRDALQNATNVDATLGPIRKALEEISRSKVVLDDKSSVIVRSADKGVKSLVKADDSGTIILLSHPKLHLTAHDKEGKLLFDGEIATDTERDAVPRELWQRVEPLLEKMEPTELEESGK